MLKKLWEAFIETMTETVRMPMWLYIPYVILATIGAFVVYILAYAARHQDDGEEEEE